MMNVGDLHDELKARYPYMNVPPLEVPKGWYGLVRQYLADIDATLTDELKDALSISEIKEKYGSLEIRTNLSELEEIEEAAETASQYVCVSCSGPGIMRHKGWVSPYCDVCYEKKG